MSTSKTTKTGSAKRPRENQLKQKSQQAAQLVEHHVKKNYT